MKVDHAAARQRADRQQVNEEDDPLFRQPHHQRAVGMVRTDVCELQCGAAQRNCSLSIDRLVGQHRVGIVQDLQALQHSPVRDDSGTRLFEDATASNVIEVVMAVDQISDRLVRDLSDLRKVLRATFGTAVPDRIGDDDSLAGDDEHRLAVLVAERVDVVGALDLSRLELGGLSGGRSGLALRPHVRRHEAAGKNGQDCAVHGCLQENDS